MGYNKDNEAETGMLAFDSDSKPFYKIVHDVKDAMKFPSENVVGSSSFGTPKQWLKFFNTEPELSRWRFHLVKVING